MPLILPRPAIRLPRLRRTTVANLAAKSKQRHLSRLSRVSESRTARVKLLTPVVNLLVNLDERLDLAAKPPPGMSLPQLGVILPPAGMSLQTLLRTKPLLRGIPAALRPRMTHRTPMGIRVGGVAVVAATAKKKAQKVRNLGRANLLMLLACLICGTRATASCESTACCQAEKTFTCRLNKPASLVCVAEIG
ncbi:unannotated protein [freshwater metagenome]|uniref:Unannotated protein n=1 Tax=freshwater metagenome TaxID=449393 RepID=A0A6J6R063_9ZZZZ